MTRTTLSWAALAVAIAGSSALAAERNSLSELKVVPTPGGAQVVVGGSRAPTFTVFRLSEPDRLVVDISSADAGAIQGHRDGAGPLSGVVVSQFSDERASVARVMLALEGAVRYDVRAEGNRLVVTVDSAQPAKSSPPPAPQAELPKEPVQRAEPAPAADHLVASRVDEKPVQRPARRITGLSYAQDTLRVTTDGELAKFELIELASPPRLALDLYGVRSAARLPAMRSELLSGARIGAHGEKVRLVLDLAGQMPAYRAVRLPRGLALSLGSASESAARPAAKEETPVVELELPQGERPAETAPIAVQPPTRAAAPSALAQVKALSFEESPRGGRVELRLLGEAQWKVERPDDRSAVLQLENARLPRQLERSLDTSALDTPVKMVSAFTPPGGASRVRVVVATDGALEQNVVKTPGGLSWRLSVKGVSTEEASVSSKAAGVSSEAVRFVARAEPRESPFKGKRVSFEFKDIEIHNLLRIFAEISKKNIIVADDVGGRVTIRLRNVPWDQALELILRSKGLGREELGSNIIRVAPLKILEEEAKLRAEKKKADHVQAELVVQLVPVNYATAAEMQPRVKEVLTDRGSVTVDTRTNTLIVRDVPLNIDKARSLVQRLDTQTPQVLIESRIVEANTTYSKQLGVQWGGRAQAAPATGNPTGLVFPSLFSVAGGAPPAGNQGTSTTPNFAVNLPAAVGLGSGGALGFVLGSAGGAVELNLRLSALEAQGVVKTISAPRVTTLDNNPARISQGVSIPFSQASAAGANTSFVEARLSLEVTPHITQDGSVLMTISAQNNQPDPASTGANGQPAIQRKEASTQVLVKDGDTTVLGGIYVRRGSSSSAGVPFFSKIPILGFFFRNHLENENRQELLIFITPRIINRQATNVAQNL